MNDIWLENILLEFGNRMLDVANNKENPTIGELIDRPKEQILNHLKEIKNGDITCFTSKYQTTPQFELPHSCDEWVIGDLEDAKEFVKDLQKTIAELEVILAPNQLRQELRNKANKQFGGK
jgi:hypothetical protein